MEEIHSLLELLALLATDPRTVVLFGLLIVASVSDYRTYKIPNWLTVSGMAFGLVYAAASPAYLHTGFLWASAGLLLGFVMMLPLYVLKVMGAGDVKLMAMVGTFLGAPEIFHAALFIFIAGGIAALAFALAKGVLVRMLGNVKNLVQLMVWSVHGGARLDVRMAAEKSVGKLPFGVCISIGTMGYVVARQLGYA